MRGARRHVTPGVNVRAKSHGGEHEHKREVQVQLKVPANLSGSGLDESQEAYHGGVDLHLHDLHLILCQLLPDSYGMHADLWIPWLAFFPRRRSSSFCSARR